MHVFWGHFAKPERQTTFNIELNDLRKIICLRKSGLCLKKKFLMPLKNWWSMAYTVCHAPIQITT